MKERKQIIVKLIATHILLPLGLVLAALLIKKVGFLLLSMTQLVLVLLFLAGYWEFFTRRFKWIFCLSVEALILLSGVVKIQSNRLDSPGLFWKCAFGLILLFLIYVLGKILIVIFKKDTVKMDIEFPFKDGKYLITDGGNSKISRLMNYHFHSPVHKKRNTNKSMLYATDVVKLGRKKTGFLPAANNDYPIFGEKVYSPIGGTIVKVINDVEDNTPFSGNYPYNTGNTVVIKKNNYYFLVGHLKKGSIVVKEGDLIAAGVNLGEAGNSGMSERPHIHMQLMESENNHYWKGMGICIRYRNKNLYKNREIQL